MELYEEAVDLALKIDHLVLAKRSANLQAAPSARKKLWLRIARRVIQRDAEPGATGTPRAGATTGRPLDEQTASRLRESVLAAATLLSLNSGMTASLSGQRRKGQNTAFECCAFGRFRWCDARSRIAVTEYPE